MKLVELTQEGMQNIDGGGGGTCLEFGFNIIVGFEVGICYPDDGSAEFKFGVNLGPISREWSFPMGDGSYQGYAPTSIYGSSAFMDGWEIRYGDPYDRVSSK
ncbi:hypothetical protein [Calidithermus roseus]|uniref:hypothetical protein n=1 Tax=Calidithermus roseus TaxID=1644118 RepID=UPI0011C37EC2|nr:hypothetical protein [Calidithermus roseus]